MHVNTLDDFIILSSFILASVSFRDEAHLSDFADYSRNYRFKSR